MIIDYRARKHLIDRKTLKWCANSRVPVKYYYVEELSDQHICNILANCHHLTHDTRMVFYTELEGRASGFFKRIVDRDATIYC